MNWNEETLDNVLVRQKDKLLGWVNELEETEDFDTFIKLKYQILGAIIILTDLWSVSGYSYKAKELTTRLQKVRENHIFKNDWK